MRRTAAQVERTASRVEAAIPTLLETIEESRAAAVAHARERAQQLIAHAKSEIEAESEAARATLGAESERIAAQIIATLLQTVGGPAAIAGGRR